MSIRSTTSLQSTFIVSSENFYIDLPGANVTSGGFTFAGVDLTIDAAKEFPSPATSDSIDDWLDKVWANDTQYYLYTNLTIAPVPDQNDTWQSVTTINIEWGDDDQNPSSGKYADEWQQCAFGIQNVFNVQESPVYSPDRSKNNATCAPVYGETCYNALYSAILNKTASIQASVNTTKNLCSGSINLDVPSQCSGVFNDSLVQILQYPLSSGKQTDDEVLFVRALNYAYVSGSAPPDVSGREMSIVYPVGLITYYSDNSAWKNLDGYNPYSVNLMCIQLDALTGVTDDDVVVWPGTAGSNANVQGIHKISAAEPAYASVGKAIIGAFALTVAFLAL